MSSCFLWISHPQGIRPFQNSKFVEKLALWVPFKAESKSVWTHPSNKLSAITWLTHEEGARGSYHASSEHQHIALAYNGWWREADSAPLDLGVAEVMLRALCGKKVHHTTSQVTKGLADYQPETDWKTPLNGRTINLEAWEALHLSPGQFSVVLADQTGSLHGINGAFGGLPLHYAQCTFSQGTSNANVTLISNRASLISAFINHGKPKRPKPESLAWLLARHEHALGDYSSAFEQVFRLHSGERVVAQAGQMKIKSIPLPKAQSYSWSALYQAFLWRVSYLRRLPQVPLSMALTGGFDSRLILGGLIATKQLELVNKYYINAAPTHIDTQAALKLAEAYEINLQVEKPGKWQSHDEDIFGRLHRHNFLVEYLCNSWDLQSGPQDLKLPDAALISGHFGELYRSHFQKYLSRSLSLMKWVYPSHWYNDRHQLLTEQMLNYTQRKASVWIKSHAQTGMKKSFIFDQIHRYARMEGWATQNQMVANLAYPSFSFLPCVSTRTHYESLTLSERKLPSVHFNLMKQVDDQIWRLPFAKSPWPRALVSDSPAAITGSCHHLGSQLQLWSKQGQNVIDFLLSCNVNSEFWQVIDRKKLHRKIKNTQTQTTAKKVKALLTATAICLALTEDIRPSQFTR